MGLTYNFFAVVSVFTLNYAKMIVELRFVGNYTVSDYGFWSYIFETKTSIFFVKLMLVGVNLHLLAASIVFTLKNAKKNRNRFLCEIMWLFIITLHTCNKDGLFLADMFAVINVFTLKYATNKAKHAFHTQWSVVIKLHFC